MTYYPADFTAQMSIVALQWAKYPNLTAELQAIATALGSDLTTHDCTIETPSAALRIGAAQTAFTNDALLLVNKGKGGNLSSATMASIINTVAAGGGSPSFIYPGAPSALYSMRRVGAGYAGNCLRVQRSSDNTRQDIGFTSAGVVDMGAIATFCAGSQATVYTWYDQSGNGNNLTYLSSAGASLPQINTIGGQPWLCFTSAQMLTTTTALAGAVLTGDMNFGFVAQVGGDYANMPITMWDGSNGWFVMLNGNNTSGQIGNSPGTIQFYSSASGGQTLGPTGRYYARTNRYAFKRAGGVGTGYVNNTQTVTGTWGNAAVTASAVISLGALNGTTSSSYLFAGLIGEVYAYGPGLGDTNRAAIDAAQATYWQDTGFSTPYSGTSAIEFSGIDNGYHAEQITFGNILGYNSTDSFTVYAAVQMYFYPAIAAVVYTNVGAGAPWYGHELWADNNGHLRVRLMSNWNGNIGAGNPGLAGVIGTTNVIDGRKHAIAFTYNGNGHVSGINVYIDGNLETTTVEQDNLSAGALVGTGANFFVGGQQPAQFPVFGTLAFFQIDKGVAQTQAYISANFKAGAIPPSPPTSSGTTDIRLTLNEGSGTAVGDTSGNARNGTLYSATMWVP